MFLTFITNKEGICNTPGEACGSGSGDYHADALLVDPVRQVDGSFSSACLSSLVGGLRSSGGRAGWFVTLVLSCFLP